MKFLLAILIVRFIVSLFTRTDSVNEEKNEAEVMHPAGFELRDHFCMRCSE